MLVSSSTYHEETSLRAGEPVDHDDSVSERHKGSKQYNGWANTKKLWLQTYGSGETAALDACGTCYRGTPPSWWFENRHKPFEVFDDPEVHHCKSYVATRPPKVSTLSLTLTCIPLPPLDGIGADGEGRLSGVRRSALSCL